MGGGSEGGGGGGGGGEGKEAVVMEPGRSVVFQKYPRNTIEIHKKYT